MPTENLNVFPARFRRMLDNRSCYECGAKMTEIERRKENGALFVWYQCSRRGCDGQWLQKIPHNNLNCYTGGGH